MWCLGRGSASKRAVGVLCESWWRGPQCRARYVEAAFAEAISRTNEEHEEEGPNEEAMQKKREQMMKGIERAAGGNLSDLI